MFNIRTVWINKAIAQLPQIINFAKSKCWILTLTHAHTHTHTRRQDIYSIKWPNVQREKTLQTKCAIKLIHVSKWQKTRGPVPQPKSVWARTTSTPFLPLPWECLHSLNQKSNSKTKGKKDHQVLVQNSREKKTKLNHLSNGYRLCGSKSSSNEKHPGVKPKVCQNSRMSWTSEVGTTLSGSPSSLCSLGCCLCIFCSVGFAFAWTRQISQSEGKCSRFKLWQVLATPSSTAQVSTLSIMHPHSIKEGKKSTIPYVIMMTVTNYSVSGKETISWCSIKNRHYCTCSDEFSFTGVWIRV